MTPRPWWGGAEGTFLHDFCFIPNEQAEVYAAQIILLPIYAGKY